MKHIKLISVSLILGLTFQAVAQIKEIDEIKKPVLHSYCSTIDSIDRMKATGTDGSSPAVDIIVISKEKRRMYLIKGDQLIYKFHATFGSNYKEGPKIQEGDRRTPEGIYYITEKKDNSKYYRALRISYPNAYDKKFAAAHGVKPGGDVMIHGLPSNLDKLSESGLFENVFNSRNWTAGCVALKNEQIDRMFESVPLDTEVAICP